MHVYSVRKVLQKGEGQPQDCPVLELLNSICLLQVEEIDVAIQDRH